LIAVACSRPRGESGGPYDCWLTRR
jgi:hypothetical protein